MTRAGARGTALLVALVVLVALSLLGLSLMFTTGVRRTGNDPMRLRGTAAAEGALVLAAARVASPEGGGVGLLRRLALPSSAEEASREAASWRSTARDVAPPVELELPSFVAVAADEGSELRGWNQEGLLTEVYRVGVLPRGGRRVTAEIRVGAVPAEAARLPESTRP